MDERYMKKCVGAPVPEWDMAHRLHIGRPVGPEIKDFGTIFEINSTFMDVVEPPFLDKQAVAAVMVVIYLFAIGIGPWFYYISHSYPVPLFWAIIYDCIAIFPTVLFGAMAWKIGRGPFFGLRYRPIRFNREKKMLYAIREKCFFSKGSEGDVVWEAPWTTKSIFCLHREIVRKVMLYQIRHYTVDDHGNVTRVFSIGREWTAGQIRLVLAQWNYWCKYMNEGPNGLPLPMLFHARHETLRESFLFSLYGIGMSLSVSTRLLAMPQVICLTALRILVNATCRDPVWPAAIEEISRVASDDPYAQPRQGMPVGWSETVLAQQRGEYPDDPNARVEGWTGEPDGRLYAAAWIDNPIPDASQ